MLFFTSDFLQNKVTCFTLLGLIPSVYLWKKLYETYISLKKEHQDEIMFHERHNCVLMYSRKRVTGWPPHVEGITASITTIATFLEPYLYFISTAKQTLDIAVMMIGIPKIAETLCEAVKRGVTVRVIVNYESMRSNRNVYIKLRNEGVQIISYVGRTGEMNSIMHNKFMVKDILNCGGFVCMGSLNLADISAFLNNFEDVVFTSNRYVTSAFHDNFEECWKMIMKDNYDIYNRTVLQDIGFLK